MIEHVQGVKVMSKTYSIGQISEKTGVTIRTLHYYDEIGLLKPAKNPTSGHRIYTDKDVFTLYKIISFKSLGMSLEKIREVLQKPVVNYSVKETLQLQRHSLYQKKIQIEKSMKAIDRILQLLEEEGEIDSDILMSLLRSIQTEEEQKAWLKNHLDEKALKTVFQLIDDDKKVKQAEKYFIKFANKVKQYVGLPVNDVKVQRAIGEYVETISKLLNLDDLYSYMELENINMEELERLTPFPFTTEEEKWYNEALDYYRTHHLLEKNKTSSSE